MQTALASVLAPLMLSTSLFGADRTPGDLPQNTKYKTSAELVFGCPAPWCFK
ncbi:hypothetical protein [Corynebacterium macginleyi]|uniref:hypothetical protein n=1 Tax=Corynebacterium macginleyi TaxID=38290 RepID=UPI00190DD0CD|nr:hypothetical protein [Corynebacterium macginleyi]